MSILLRNDVFCKDVMDFIYQKQTDFKKDKARTVSLGKTIERLLKEAYGKEITELKVKK